jgi:hypothetical protein
MELRTMRVSTSDITGKRKGSGSNDIFEKCRNFTRPSDLQAAGLYMYFEVFGDREGCGAGEVRMGGRKVLMFGSNDYLDLITHPKVKEASVQALKKYGSGCSGSRLLNGTLDLHVKLEHELAAFVHKEAAIIFGTGFQANYATLSALTEKGDIVNASGDTPNKHDILTGSQGDGTAYPAGDDKTCHNWTSSSEGAVQVGHHNRNGTGPPPATYSWNSAHTTPGCSDEALRKTGGAGLIYCFAVK